MDTLDQRMICNKYLVAGLLKSTDSLLRPIN
jgi:hypothetical protein